MRKTLNLVGMWATHMVLHNASIDPHTAERDYYECRSCGERTVSDERVETCTDCGGDLRNIGVARE